MLILFTVKGCHRTPPSHGSLLCAKEDMKLSKDGFCMPMCKDGFEFKTKPAKFYVCSFVRTHNSQYNIWSGLNSAFKQGGRRIWPDCGRSLIVYIETHSLVFGYQYLNLKRNRYRYHIGSS